MSLYGFDLSSAVNEAVLCVEAEAEVVIVVDDKGDDVVVGGLWGFDVVAAATAIALEAFDAFHFSVMTWCIFIARSRSDRLDFVISNSFCRRFLWPSSSGSVEVFTSAGGAPGSGSSWVVGGIGSGDSSSGSGGGIAGGDSFSEILIGGEKFGNGVK